jgi:peptidoglycan/xylan/chitin deacetylase (PgdA/CDA1 family)
MIVLMMLLPLVPETHHLRPTTAFGQESYLSNQSPSSSFLSQDQKSNSMIADYSLSPSTGVNGGGGIGSSSSSNSVSNGYSNINNNNNTSKLVFLNFDDGFQSQYTYAKPILDKYGFKASFFVVCNYAGKPDRMSWQEITTLHNEGYDIESHSMNHNQSIK